METRTFSQRKRRRFEAESVTPQVTRLRDKIVNSYIVGEPSSKSWVVIDAGMSPGHARKIFRAAEELFGKASRPAAILLTHGHFDHVGALEELLKVWDVPVYAHELELPYLTGLSDYPPPDPTVGGGIVSRMSPMFSNKGINIRERVQRLPEDGSVPGLPGWRWIHTPGHTEGHVSFFRDTDRMLIAGDAIVTVKNESVFALLFQKQRVCRPPAYFTSNWEEAKESVLELAELQPEVAATGHGVPMRGVTLRYELQTLAANFREEMPHRGRYISEPAVADATGVRYVPPPAPDPIPKILAGAAVVLATAFIVRRVRKRTA